MKILITDNNIPYDNGYANILKFDSEEARDNYVETYLASEWKNRLESAPDIYNQNLGIIDNYVEIASTREQINKKNYCIIKDNNENISFHFILNIENLKTNNNFGLTLEKDINMTYPLIWDQIKNTFAEQTHLNNYFGYEMDGGHKELIGISDLPYVAQNEIYQQLTNKGWLVVFERVNDESDYLQKSTNGKIYKEPYKIYVAPLKPFTTTESGTSEYVLYEQPNPIKYDVLSRYGLENKTTINIGLSNTIDTNFDLSFTSSFYSDDKKYNVINKQFTLKSNYLKILNDYNSLYVVIPYSGDSEEANASMNMINPPDLGFQDPYIRHLNFYNKNGLNWGEEVYLLPLKITKIESTAYTFEILQISELVNIMDDAEYVNAGTNIGIWTKYKDYENQDVYGLISPTNDNLTDSVKGQITINKISQFQSNTWSSDNLFNYLEDPDNANIIGSRITNFIPIDTNQTEGVFSILQSNNVRYNDSKDIYYLNFLNYDNLLKVNKHYIDFSQYSKYDLIEGLNIYSFGIENLKEFDLNANFINKETKQMTFEHYASFTPDWEERLKFTDNKYLNLTNDENSFLNEKEFIKGSDLLAQYKVNNPVKSKLEWFRPFFSAANIASIFLGKAKGVKRIGKTITSQKFGRVGTETILGPRGGTTYKPKYGKRTTKTTTNYNEIGGGNNGVRNLIRALPLLGGIAQVPVNRANMRKQPDQFQGNGDINGDLILNYNSINFSLYTYEFITPTRKAIIRDLKMHGVNDQIFLETLWDYKQSSFNFYLLNDLDFSNNETLKQNLNQEEYDKLNEICTNGFTLWYDPQTYLDWESNLEEWKENLT